MSAEARLKEKNIVLPPRNKPVANYVTAVRVGNLLFLAGHGPRQDVPMRFKGKLGKDLTIEQGYEAAREVGLCLLATTRGELGSLDKVKRVVKVLGMVNTADGFGDQPKVINGFSDLMVEVFGDLREGDEVVRRGNDEIRNGAPVGRPPAGPGGAR